jgi:hypothetical protein
MFEIQKIEELKQEIDKSTSLKEYINKEIEEMEERLLNTESENKSNLIEYKIKKQELEQKLVKLKNEMINEEALNQEEKNKYIQIENDIKNKISFVSLQNSNIIGNSFDNDQKESLSYHKDEVHNEQNNHMFKDKNNNNNNNSDERREKTSSTLINDESYDERYEKVEAEVVQEKKNLRTMKGKNFFCIK